jgi:hypothetical protein
LVGGGGGGVEGGGGGGVEEGWVGGLSGSVGRFSGSVGTWSVSVGGERVEGVWRGRRRLDVKVVKQNGKNRTQIGTWCEVSKVVNMFAY